MEFTIGNNRLFSLSPDGALLAELTFPARDAKRIDVDHVFVDESLRGQGIAGRMMERICDYARANGLMIVAKCPYAIDWFKKHPERQDVVVNVKTEKKP
jgi:predicted GNAT family acetyltransferase